MLGDGEKKSWGLPRVRVVAPRRAFAPGGGHLPRLGGILQRRTEAQIVKVGLGLRSASKVGRKDAKSIKNTNQNQSIRGPGNSCALVGEVFGVVLEGASSERAILRFE